MARRMLQGIHERGEALAVAENAPASTLTYTVPGGAIWLDRIEATGTFAAKYDLYIDGELAQTRHAEAQDPHALFEFHDRRLKKGTLIEVRVTHYSTGHTHDFEATLKAHR